MPKKSAAKFTFRQTPPLRQTPPACSVGEFSSFAHEMKKPLAVMRGLISGCGAGSLPEAERVAEEIDVEISRAVELLDNMEIFVRLAGEPKCASRISLSEICGKIFEQQRANFPEQHFRREIAEGVSLRAVPEYIAAIVENLLDNAGRHNFSGTEISFILRKTPQEAVILVRDDGRGLGKIGSGKLVPFAKSGGTAGSGLGLSIVQRAAEKLGGTLAVRSVSGRGSEFAVRIPTS